MANGNGVTPSDYTASDWTPQEWKAAWDRGAIGGNTGLPLFAPGSVKVNSRGEVYNPARVGAGGVNTGVRFPRGDEQPPPVATPAAYKPGDPPPPAPANENINDPTPPAAPADKPVAPGQYSPTPWGHPQVAGIPRMPGHGGVIGNATPDGTLTPPLTSPNNPYWMNTPRGQPAVTPFQPQIQRFSNEYGLPPALFNALVHAESGYKPNAVSSTGAVGLGQLEPGTAREMGVNNPYDPEQNLQGAARYLRMMYERYHSWTKAISAYNRGPGGAEKTGFSVAGYSNYDAGRSLIATAAALDGGVVKAGPLVPPPQNYRPASYTPPGGYPSMLPDRPPSQWGRDEPSMFEGPGSIPHQREIPGILQGLAPFLMIGLALFSKGAALPMLSGFSGYMKARAARQEKDAKELKTFYQDKLKETKAKLGLEQGDAAAAMAMPAGPQRDEALQRIALEYGDSQLQAIVEQGGDPTALFQQRDKAYQDISKTNAAELAERRELVNEEKFAAEQQKWYLEQQEKNEMDPLKKTDLKNRIAAQQKKIDDANKALKAAHDAGFTGGVPDTSGSDEKGDGESGSEPAAPAESPAAPAPSDSDTPGESGAATPPAPAATPASASAAPTQEPPPDTGRDQIVDAQGDPVRPRSDIQPAVYRGGAPAAQPATDTTAPAADERIPTPGIQSDSPADAFVSDLTTGGSLDDVPKEYRTQALTGAAWRKGKLDQLAKLSPSSGADFNREIARIDPGVAGVVQRIVDVDQGLPGGSGMSSRLQAYTQTLANLAKKQKPTWDASQWKSKQDLRDDFTKGWRSRTIYRINNLGGAAANVLKEVNRIPPSDQNWQAFANEMLAKGTTSNKEYAGLAAAIRTFAMESTGSTQMGQPGVTLTEELIRSAMPLGSTPAAIREALKIDLGNAVRGFDTLKNEWSSNFHDSFSSAGYNPENDQAFQAIENNLDPDTGLFIDQKSGQPTTDVPTILQPGLMPIIQDGKRFDPVTHRYLGPA